VAVVLSTANRGFMAQGSLGVCPDDASRRDRSTVRALPQPNRLEHLMSRFVQPQIGDLRHWDACDVHARTRQDEHRLAMFDR
jgi:hypothetical protein